MMEAIRPLREAAPIKPLRPLKTPQESDGVVRVSPFGDIFATAVDTVLGADADPMTDMFRSAVQAVRETDAEKVRLEYLMATGQLDNPALLSIAASKAQTSVQLLMQLRDKALDAYNELMRLSL